MKTLKLTDGSTYDVAITSSESALVFVLDDFAGCDPLVQQIKASALASLDDNPLTEKAITVITAAKADGGVQLIDRGTGNKILRFTINPTAFINNAVNTIIVTAGTVSGNNGTDTITALDLTTATVTKTLTGLQFEIDSGIVSGGAAVTGFINLSIAGMGLSFSMTP